MDMFGSNYNDMLLLCVVFRFGELPRDMYTGEAGRSVGSDQNRVDGERSM